MAEQAANKVPQIRFKGFDGTWEEKKLGTLCAIGDADHWMPETTSQGIPYVMTGDFFGVNEIAFDNAKLISEADYEKLTRKIKPELGDILFARYASVGAVRLVRTARRFIVSYSCAILKNNNSFSSQNLFYLLQSDRSQNQLKQSINTGSQGNVGIESLKQLAAIFPDKSEQTQIGEYFRALDSLIELHQRKHDKLVTLKKAMIQKMFPQPGATTPEIRFKGFEGDWVEKKLGECALIQRGGSPRPIEDFITQEANGINWVKIGDVKLGSRYITKTEGKIKPEGVSKSREVFKGDLILSNSMSFGRPYLMAIDGCIHDGWLLIRNDKNLFDLDYLLQLLSSETMTEQYRSLAAGGVVNNLNSALVQSTNISFPDKPEQQKIGIYFRQLDALISQHATQLQKLKQLKSACLEKMFV